MEYRNYNLARPVIFVADAANQPVRAADCGRTAEPEDPAAPAGAIRSLIGCSEPERALLAANARACVERNHHDRRLADEPSDPLLEGVG